MPPGKVKSQRCAVSKQKSKRKLLAQCESCVLTVLQAESGFRKYNTRPLNLKSNKHSMSSILGYSRYDMIRQDMTVSMTSDFNRRNVCVCI